MKKITLSVDGMTCAACSSGLEKYLKKQKGVMDAVVNLVMSTASIVYDENIITKEKIEEFVKEAGFISLGEFKEIKIEKEKKKEKIKFIIFTILIILLMYISMGHMVGLKVIDFLNIHTHQTNYLITIFLLTCLFLIYGFNIIKNGIINLIHRIPNMDSLVSLGVLTTFIYSLVNMILVLNGNNDLINNIYFESSAVIIYFIVLGRRIDKISKDKTKEAINTLVTITPTHATRKIGDTLETVTIDEIKKEDIIVAKEGEKIAVDGIIIKGTTHVDESFITGESKPVQKTVGDTVVAGSLNFDGLIEYTAKRIGKDSSISEIVKLVVEATNTKPKIASLADTVANYFVKAIILIAILAFIIYLLLGFSLNESLITFVTVLVVACPCSLGLATPLAIVVSEGLCAKNGILIKKSLILELASKVNTVIFDKTGTLTYGKLKVSRIFNYSSLKEKELLTLVCSLETKVNHPISNAFNILVEEKHLNLLNVNEMKTLQGLGITGKIDKDKIIIGSSKILEKYKIKNTHKIDEEKLLQNGNTIIYVVKNKEILALIGVNDIVRNEAKEVVKDLNNMGIDVVMLTGDNEKTANIIGEYLNINKIISNVLPKEKSNKIKELQNNNQIVLMCGDGINDSIALKNADIALSFNSGTDIAMNSSDVLLINDNLNNITKLIKISKETLKIIKQNLFWAFFYNSLMIPVALGLFKNFGISVSPMMASLSMVLSSLTVILNTLRLKLK